MGRGKGSINEEEAISEGRWELQKQTMPAAILDKNFLMIHWFALTSRMPKLVHWCVQ